MTELLERHRPESGQRDRRGWEWYFLTSLAHRNMATLRGHTGRVGSVSWDPASRRLVTAGMDSQLRIWEPMIGKEILVVPGYHANQSTLPLSPPIELESKCAHPNKQHTQ
jgi:WD40 repeat protein